MESATMESPMMRDWINGLEHGGEPLDAEAVDANDIVSNPGKLFPFLSLLIMNTLGLQKKNVSETNMCLD